MLVINAYTSVKLLPATAAKEGKKAPPRRIVVDGTQYLTVWASELPALRAIVAAGGPIPVNVRARAWLPEGAESPIARVDLAFAGGTSLEDEAAEGETLA